MAALLLALFRTPSTPTTSATPASTSSAPPSTETTAPAASTPPPAPPGEGDAVVREAVDIYDIPDGVGNVIGVLHPGRRIGLVEPCRDGWCHVVLPEMPGGTGWVWGEFLDF